MTQPDNTEYEKFLATLSGQELATLFREAVLIGDEESTKLIREAIARRKASNPAEQSRLTGY
jgi:hypothetical protein